MKIETKVLGIFVLSGVLIFLSIIYIALSANERLANKVLIHGHALNMIQQMQSAAMNAVQESFAYITSGEQIKKQEYLEWKNSFSSDLNQFVFFVSLNDIEAEGEGVLVSNLIAAQNNYTNSADVVFSEYENNGSLTAEVINHYESKIDTLDTSFKLLYENEIKESVDGKGAIVAEMRQQKAIAYIFGVVVLIFSCAFGWSLYLHIANETRLREKNERLLHEARDAQESERREAAAQIIQASKLATLGEMATSVAHELNQPLNVIRMAAGNTRRKISKGTADPEYLNDKLERIEEQTARAAAIIDHMRMFGREAKEDPESIDLRDMVTNALDLMGEQLRLAGIEIVTELAQDCPSVLGHAIQMEQVLLNLLSNAKDAMAERNGEAKITLRMFADDQGVHLTSEDTGGGIPEEVLPRIFDPFYTTKEMGKGTGLGLSVSYGIIRDMNGTIVAENLDNGARFTITVPIAR
jgi:signal transduction histidine kinase